MMAHIRYATQGAVNLENVHPFQREMWGIQWCFAHNGEVPKYTGTYKNLPLLGRTKRQEKFYLPVGDTDSEATFCAILNALRAEFPKLPTLPVLYETLQRLCCEIVAGQEDTTIFNFLLGCGEYTLFAYSWPGARPGSKVWNGLHYTVRRPPFSKAKLVDLNYSVDFAEVTTAEDRVAVIATAPLTSNEEWIEFKRGQLLMFDQGRPYSELYDCQEVETQGHGLASRTFEKSFSLRLQDTPSVLRQLVDDSIEASLRNTKWAKNGADLGCGTGLSGAAFRSCVQHLVGVEISPEMIDRAKERGCYDQLELGDVVDYVGRSHNGHCCDNIGTTTLRGGCSTEASSILFDIMFACDVLVYIGNLHPVFRAVRDGLAQDGFFAFSAEILEEKEESQTQPKQPNDNESNDTKQQQQQFVLQPCARFAHEQSYIENLATEYGFATKVFTSSPVRKYEDREVVGILVVLQKI
eukprot:CAMPEP_0195287170 /NCGR_PEP_ID=MMETSP0707-20130614/4344_1 /TAXON_ID=33640 /ORGANISM="Asterionellopsis glacialis, Strain CCMP134" /LENGTH=465 /DNA_ID=CAMNT_0040346899 /DNA_START=183 /DNA_END=1580 /DNA_ORIENTATION=+